MIQCNFQGRSFPNITYSYLNKTYNMEIEDVIKRITYTTNFFSLKQFVNIVAIDFPGGKRSLRIKMRAQLKILILHSEDVARCNETLESNLFSKCFNLSCLVAIMVLHLKILSWALLFILKQFTYMCITHLSWKVWVILYHLKAKPKVTFKI